MRRYELTDEQLELLGDLLPLNGRRGGQWSDYRTTLNGIFWILHAGAQWREMPERYGNWKSVYAASPAGDGMERSIGCFSACR